MKEFLLHNRIRFINLINKLNDIVNSIIICFTNNFRRAIFDKSLKNQELEEIGQADAPQSELLDNISKLKEKVNKLKRTMKKIKKDSNTFFYLIQYLGFIDNSVSPISKNLKEKKNMKILWIKL